jgi:hypothetical protein
MRNIETGSIQHKRGTFDNHTQFLKLLHQWNMNQPKTYVYWETMETLIPKGEKVYQTNYCEF